MTGATVPLVAAIPAGALPGIDVSHHQGPIDWSQVAAAGTRFAFAKATEGRNYIDPQYATNKAGAALSGVAFGAYHFARPDRTANDAVLEADHFVDVSQLEPGDLVPVLDIERNEDQMSQAEMTQWILTWLNRVNERVGVRPMVYTSPHGWATRTGDTTAVADAGYSLLWVAHWNVASPTVPGANWSGNGWTFWQYGNCGTVPGIVGCVDVDWYEGGPFDPVTIPAPDDVAPTATFALPATPAEPLSISFSEIVHQVTPENAYVWIPSTGTYPALELTCRSGKGADVDCVSGNVRRALVRPLGSFVLGETYEAVVNPAIAPVLVVDRSANPVATTTQGFATPTEVEEDSPAISYGWRTASNAGAKGGSYAVEHRAGATASFMFAGGSVTWFTAVGPNRGMAKVRIDGVAKGTFDQYAARPAFGVARSFDGLGPGEHSIDGPRARTGTREGDRHAGRRGRVPCRRRARLEPRPRRDLGRRREGLGVGREPRLERPRAFERRGDVPRHRDRLVHREGTRPGARQDLRGRAARSDRRQLRGVARVRRRALDLRLRGRRPHLADRGAGDREARGDGRARLGRPLRDRSLAGLRQAPAALAMRSAAASGSRNSVFRTRS